MTGDAAQPAATVAAPAPDCPLCGANLPVLSEQCPACGGDLGPLVRAADMPDRYFNEALAACRHGKWSLAAERLAVTLALRPDDVDALVLLGKVRYRQQRRGDAVAAWQEAVRLAPGREDARLAIARVRDGAPARDGPSRRRRARHGRQR